MAIQVIKLNGEREPYSPEKIRRSATRVGVPQNVQGEMLKHIESYLYDGIPTSEIFAHIKEFLRSEKGLAYVSRFNLKQGLAELGPSGYPFEKYLALLLEEDGYTTKTNQLLAGRCVRHEIDVTADNGETLYIIEAKFHSKHGVRVDVKTTLYIKARYDDVKKNWKNDRELRSWLITNTRFTSDARKYAQCEDLKLTSWDYPEGESLRERIDATGLHPVTILDSASQKNKKALLENGIVTCKQILEDEGKLRTLVSDKEYQTLRKEARAVCAVT